MRIEGEENVEEEEKERKIKVIGIIKSDIDERKVRIKKFMEDVEEI